MENNNKRREEILQKLSHLQKVIGMIGIPSTAETMKQQEEYKRQYETLYNELVTIPIYKGEITVNRNIQYSGKHSSVTYDIDGKQIELGKTRFIYYGFSQKTYQLNWNNLTLNGFEVDDYIGQLMPCYYKLILDEETKTELEKIMAQTKQENLAKQEKEEEERRTAKQREGKSAIGETSEYTVDDMMENVTCSRCKITLPRSSFNRAKCCPNCTAKYPECIQQVEQEEKGKAKKSFYKPQGFISFLKRKKEK